MTVSPVAVLSIFGAGLLTGLSVWLAFNLYAYCARVGEQMRHDRAMNLALEDLGDQLLLSRLQAGAGDEPYRDAMELLLQIAAIDTGKIALPAYDEALLREELGDLGARLEPRG